MATPLPSDDLVSIKLINQCQTSNTSETSVRRFALVEKELTFEALMHRAVAAFGLEPNTFQICYTDDENDQIKVRLCNDKWTRG